MKKLHLIFLNIFCASLTWAQSTPTWSDNVAGILYQNCSSCHHSGGIAPFPLMSYADAQGLSSAIFNAVSNDLMPPWPPDTSFQRYAHERVLSVSQKQAILDWLNGGMPYGNPANEPNPPVFSDGSQLSVIPSISLRIPDYTVTSPIDIYQCFVIPSGTTQDAFIKGFELLPGNRSIVHHVLVFQDTTGTCAALDAADPAPGYTSFGGVGSNDASLIAAWVPGSTPRIYPAGMGIPMQAGADLVLQIHYPSGVAGELDSTRINLVLDYSSGLRPLYISPILDHGLTMTNGPLIIPPNLISTFNNQYTTPLADFTILDVAPHMHLLGKSIEAYGLTLQGDTIPFVRINDWRFHWQGSYSFRKLLKVPPLTVLKGEASYDNTVNNPNNPNSPPQYVFLGEGTADEMMLVYFTYTPYYPGDEEIIQDSTLLTTNKLTNLIETSVFSVFPNPTNNHLVIRPNSYVDLTGNIQIHLIDLSGKSILAKSIRQLNGAIEIELDQTMAAGFYLGKITTSGGQFEFKFAKN
jgi:hypothetical protein